MINNMALLKGDGPIVDSLSPLDIDGPTKFRARYRSNEKTRSVGWGIMGVGNGIGLLLSAASINSDDIDEGMLLAGTGLAITSTLLALFLSLKKTKQPSREWIEGVPR